MFRCCVVVTAALTLSACSTGPLEPVRSADAVSADTRCRTTPQPDGGSSVGCTLWERTTTTTTTTTVLPSGESATTVQRTRTGDDR